MTIYPALALLLFATSACTTVGDGAAAQELTIMDSVFWGNQTVFNGYENLKKPLDEELLRALASDPKSDRSQLGTLIRRAAADRNSKFRALLNSDRLREDPYFMPSLAAYDFQVDGDEEALEFLCSEPPPPWSHFVWTLAFIDEWDRSIEAIERESRHVDGSLGLDLGMFWVIRERLFPEAYHKNKYRPEVRRLLVERLGKDVRKKLDANANGRTTFHGLRSGWGTR